MKVVALLLALLCARAHADPEPVYLIKATRTVGEPRWSCGAVPRMLKDRHTLTYRDGAPYVNGLRWSLDVLGTDEVVIAFHAEQHTGVAMYLWSDDRKVMGVYQLWGLRADRTPCMDRVYVVGERIR